LRLVGLHSVDEAHRDVPELAVVSHRRLSQDLEGLFGGYAPLRHDHALGLLDDRPRLQPFDVATPL
jgi:hypothetical protein